MNIYQENLNRDIEEKQKKRKAKGANYGHVKRRLINKEPLTGKTLELALELVEVYGDDEFAKLLRNIGNKIKAGQPLGDYELHIMIDMIVPHARLSG